MCAQIILIKIHVFGVAWYKKSVYNTCIQWIEINFQIIFLKLVKIKHNNIQFFRVVIPLCGGNIDTTVLGRCLDRGLAVDGRLVRFLVTVSDRPGGIAELAKLVCSIGVRYVH